MGFAPTQIRDPDPHRAREKYRRHASGYDASARRTMGLRQRAITWLELAPGDRVLDVACGTGPQILDYNVVYFVTKIRETNQLGSQ